MNFLPVMNAKRLGTEFILYSQDTESAPGLQKLCIFCLVCSGLLHKVDFESLSRQLLTLARAIPKAQ